MALDASILQGFRPIEPPSRFDSYKNALAIEGGLNQNAMAQYALAKAKREDADQNALRASLANLDINTPEGQSATRNALLRSGNVKGAMEFDKSVLERDKTKLEMGKTLIDQATRALAGATTDEQADQVFQFWKKGSPEQAELARIQYVQARNGGVPPQQILPKIAAMFNNDMLKHLEAMAPKVEFEDIGGSKVAVNKNTLAGPVGPMAGVNSMTKTNTPDALLTDERTRTEGAANRGVTMRGQNMTDARQREANAQGHTQVVTDGAGNTIVVNKDTKVAVPVTDASGKVLPPKLSEHSKKEIQSIDAQANTVAQAIKAAKNNPDAFGVARGLATMSGTVPETAANMMSSDANIQARSFVFNVVSKVINERAGAAQSAQELARLRSFLPAETDRADVIESKLKGFEKYLSEQRKAFESAPSGKTPAGATGGWKVEREG